MRLAKKISEWRRESVIDDITAEKITSYEQQRSHPVLLWAFGGMGAFAVIVGLVSIIAANWLYTPDWVKLGVDLSLNLILAVALYLNCTKQQADKTDLWVREVLVILYYGLALASMALVGQIYQLGGSVDGLLLLWTLVTVPLVLLARGRFIAAAWMVATVITYIFNAEELRHYILYGLALDDRLLESIFVSIYVLMPLQFILVSRIPWLVRNRLQAADVISRFSWLAVVVIGFLMQFLWYENISGLLSNHLLVICSAATLVMIAFISRLYPAETADVHLAMRVVLLAVLVLGVSAVWVSQQQELAGALTNLLYLCLLAWAAIKIHSPALFNFFTAVICVRILVIYFEVFGSMMETGIGLVTGGILTLLVSWWWFKRSNRLAMRLAEAARESS